MLVIGLFIWPVIVCLLFHFSAKRKTVEPPKVENDFATFTKEEKARLLAFYELAYNLGVEGLPTGVIATKLDGMTVVEGMSGVNVQHAPMYKMKG